MIDPAPPPIPDGRKYSGGEIIRPAISGMSVWNRDPLEPRPQAPVYRLTVAHLGHTPPLEATATAHDMETLVEFNRQMRRLDYAFILLELVPPESP